MSSTQSTTTSIFSTISATATSVATSSQASAPSISVAGVLLAITVLLLLCLCILSWQDSRAKLQQKKPVVDAELPKGKSAYPYETIA
ncbi:hypothetical protein HDU78_011045 [Chytriomyces hyalinus]|nr:hypothetical protein HDU78_011045 [Chytriomyces hyalinus]